MAKSLGSSGVLLIAGSAVANIKNASFSLSADEVEVTDNESGTYWKDFLMGNRSGTFSFTCNADALYSGGDAEQKSMVDALADASAPYAYQTAITFVYKPHGATTNYYQYTFTGYVQEVSHDMSNNEVVELNVTVRITSSVAVAAHA
jgi:hypothetical protein